MTSTSHSGDLGEFILQSVARYGGEAKKTNGLPRIDAQWKAETLTGAEYLGDREQFSIIVQGDRFQQVRDFLSQAYGTPFQQATSTPSGPHGFYSKNDIGVAVQFYRDEKETALILVGVRKR
jgi:hypothetical protein